MKRFYTLLFFYALFCLQPLQHALNIKMLKGTHTILQDTTYSPFRGLIFLEESIAEQWYRFSSSHQIREINEFIEELKKYPEEIGPQKLEAGEFLAKSMVQILTERNNNATENLLMHLFNIAGGTFNVTAAPNSPVRQLQPKHIGALCKILYESTQQSDLDKDIDYKNVLLAYKATRQKVTPEDRLASIQELLKKYSKILGKTELQTVLRNYQIEKITNFLFALEFKKSSGSKFEKKDFNLFVKDLVNSLYECDPLNPNHLYPNGTTVGILLGYMLAKVNSHGDLQDYFRAFLGNESFVLPQAEYTRQELEALANPPKQENEEELEPTNHVDLTKIEDIADYLCALVFIEKYCSALPKIATNTNVEYQGNEFPDCVEMMMYNLVNILTYDAATQTLGNIPKQCTLNLQLKTFYANKLNANPATIGAKDVHRSWLKLVENQEGCSYNRCVVRGTKHVLELRTLCDGIIPIDNESLFKKLPQKQITIANKNYTVFEKKIGTNNYWLTPATGELDCFELMPTMPNMILILNRLFGLNLATIPQRVAHVIKGQSFDQQALQVDFSATYFEQMCKRFGWQIPQEILARIKTPIIASPALEIPVTLATGEEFIIELYAKAHGTVTIPLKSLYKDGVSLDNFITLDKSVQAALLAAKAISPRLFPYSYSVGKFNAADFRQIDKFISTVNKDERIEYIRSFNFWEHETKLNARVFFPIDPEYLAQIITTFATEMDEYYQTELFSCFADLPTLSPNIIKILDILAQGFYLGDNYSLGGKIIYDALNKNFDKMWHWIDLGIQGDDDLKKHIVMFLADGRLLLELKKQNQLPPSKIDMLLTWINTGADSYKKNNENDESSPLYSYGYLLQSLIRNDLINQDKRPMAKKILEKYEAFDLDSDFSWMQDEIDAFKNGTISTQKQEQHSSSDDISDEREVVA